MHTRAMLAAAAVLVTPALPAAAQTAYDVNRLNQAIQICNSPLGAGTPECAKLRGQLGGGGGGGVAGLGGLGGLGGGKAQAAAGILGMLSQARASAPQAMAPPAANPAAVQQAIATCVQGAGGNNAVIQACLQIASAGQAPAAAPRPSLGIGAYQAAPQPGANSGQAAAMATYQGAQSYQACAAANPTNWQSCMPLLNGAQPR